MSAEAVGWTWRHSPYKGAVLLAHLAIADTVNDQHYNELWMSQRALAAKARIDRKSANQALQTLCRDGMLSLLEERPGKTSRYRFEFPQVDVVYESRVRRQTPPLGSGSPPGEASDPTEPKRTQKTKPSAAPKNRRRFLVGTGWIEEAG